MFLEWDFLKNTEVSSNLWNLANDLFIDLNILFPLFLIRAFFCLVVIIIFLFKIIICYLKEFFHMLI